MKKNAKHVTVFLIIVSLFVFPCISAVMAQDLFKEDKISSEKMAADLVAVRPLGIASTALGFVGYIVSLPFSIPGGNSQDVWQTMVVDPAKFTFTRPLGEF